MPDELFAPPKPPDPFVGRRSELETIDQLVSDSEVGYGRPLVVTGVAGIGKSSLVAKYLESPRPLIFAGRPGSGKTAELLRRARDRVTRNMWIPAREFPGIATQFDSVMRARADERIPDSILVVLDGADKMKEDDRLKAVSHILNFKRVRTLIVTSRALPDLRGERILQLDRLQTDDAQSLIIDASQSIISSESMQKMLGVADGLPLALKLLAALAKSRSEEELRQLLAGHIYDLKQDGTVPQGKLLAIAKPVIISQTKR
jgi:hypothetical protein